MDQVTIIGGADGPTSVFLAGKTGGSWISVWGLIIVLLLLLPNLLFVVKKQGTSEHYEKGIVDHLQKITRITTMLLMIFQFDVFSNGFHSVLAFLIYFYGNVILVVLYWILWIVYKKNQADSVRKVLIEIPCVIYILSALTWQHWVLLASAIIFTVCHSYIKFVKRK